MLDGEGEERWKTKKDEGKCVHCLYLFKDKNEDYYFYENDGLELKYCSLCHSKVKKHCQKSKQDEEERNKERRDFSREILLKRLKECKDGYYKANKELENLSESI